ncbi:MAG: sugar phosphate isomerase/epimerase [Clostridia bacterium]|nr:sugar phosphate isomerase/epimerase [Clostridia bacterium]
MSFPIAVQIYSVRENAKADLEGTLKAIKAMGYDGVEFAGLYDIPAENIRDMCKDIGLVPISAHVPFMDMIKNPHGVLSQYATIGCKYVAIPSLPGELRPGTPNYEYTLDYIKVIGKAAKALGIQLCYHNHDFEFMKIGGKYALDVMYETVPADLLATELDTCWVNVGGVNPADYVRKYTGRAPVVHVKDFFGEKTENMYELIGEENKAPKRPEGFEFRPVGAGLQNIPSIVEASKDAGAEWLIVEQDSPSMGLTPMECIEKSIEYLKTINN